LLYQLSYGTLRSAMRSHRMPSGGIKATHTLALSNETRMQKYDNFRENANYTLSQVLFAAQKLLF
ncbi:MAG: hypothetical protein IJQ97_06910, partial [Paludibacteraceae bacterium]|nr:hypothetical protein [Paludibacteraceae bacterium]